jgi:hypothetical protein
LSPLQDIDQFTYEIRERIILLVPIAYRLVMEQAQIPSSSGKEGRVKQLFKKYGKVALGVHLTVYAVFFAGMQPSTFFTPITSSISLPGACS